MAGKKHECPNCGYVFSGNDRNCKFCGTPNPDYTPTYGIKNAISNAAANLGVSSSNSSDAAPAREEKKFSLLIFLLLLIFAWPVAIVYAILKAK